MNVYGLTLGGGGGCGDGGATLHAGHVHATAAGHRHAAAAGHGHAAARHGHSTTRGGGGGRHGHGASSSSSSSNYSSSGSDVLVDVFDARFLSLQQTPEEKRVEEELASRQVTFHD